MQVTYDAKAVKDFLVRTVQVVPQFGLRVLWTRHGEFGRI